MPEALNEQLLDERLAQLEKARTWSPRLISKLESHIRTGTTRRCFASIRSPSPAKRMRPTTKSSISSCTPQRSACSGWIGRCFARNVAASWRASAASKGVHNHYRCSFCQVGYETALDDYVAVSFTISPDVRPISFHHPERLSAWDNFIKVGNTRDGVLPDGTALHRRQGKARQGRSAISPPGETTRLEIDVD